MSFRMATRWRNGWATGQFFLSLCCEAKRQSDRFTIRRSEVRPFTAKQIELAETFADQAVIAIENVRLFEEVQARTRDLAESLEQQTATSEVLQVISASPGELEPVFQKMLENATRVCGAKFGTIFLSKEASFGASRPTTCPSRRPMRPRRGRSNLILKAALVR